ARVDPRARRAGIGGVAFLLLARQPAGSRLLSASGLHHDLPRHLHHGPALGRLRVPIRQPLVRGRRPRTTPRPRISAQPVTTTSEALKPSHVVPCRLPQCSCEKGASPVLRYPARVSSSKARPASPETLPWTATCGTPDSVRRRASRGDEQS